ncbi:phosphoribosylaminoimidazolesuccinocarboxamide synthase [Candidatus Bathyarchaeota archaeon]|nr:MAG: phosphoribosylaminoimidazolesuccinocarboxamide synthase [Candidatus Bathyarchaeota archaeon]
MSVGGPDLEESYLVPDPLGPGYVEVLRASNLPGRRLLRRGKVRDIYDLGEELLLVATDRISAFDVVYPTLIPHKGVSLHALSVYWFQRTRDIFPNHLIESVDERTMRVVKAERIDIEWICRAYLYGSAWRAYKRGVRVISGVRLPNGLQMAEELPEVILTPTTKSEVGHDVELSKDEGIDRGLVTRDEWSELEEATYRLFDYYRREAERRGIIIPDFKLEYGRWRGTLIQIDEPPTHDSARFWDMRRYEPGKPQEAHCLDKEFLREYLRRIGYTGDGEPPEIPGPVVREISKRCVASYEVLSGRRPIDAFDLKTVDEVLEELSDESP